MIFFQLYLFLLLAPPVCNTAYCSQGTIIPSTLQGVCTACNTTSCSNCQKLGSVEQAEQQASTGCGACKQGSAFCQGLARADGSVLECLGHCTPHYSAFIPRSQGSNTARELAGWEEFIHQADTGCYYLTTGHALGYSRSFRPERIARFLFGDTTLRFAGSQVADRGPCEILADNFGLSPSLRGTVTVNPTIENIIFDNHFFFGLDPLLSGLYLRINLAVVHTRWNLRMEQRVEIVKSSQNFPTGYMASDEVPASGDMLRSLAGNSSFGDMKQPLLFGHIAPGLQTKTGLATCALILGYDLRQTDTSHFGFYTQLGIPTGNRYDGSLLFQPLVGNARHVELGAGFSGHMTLLEYDAHHSLSLYVEAQLVHMLKNTQLRSFDFCGHGPLSRYMLLKELDKNLEYTGTLINGINIATRPVHVRIAAKGDVSAKLAIRTPRIIADIGYNFFGQTGESVNFCDFFDERTFVIKGTEGVCCLEYATQGEPPSFGALRRKIALNSSQSGATLRQAAATDNPQDPDVLAPTDTIVTAFSRQQGPVTGTDVVLAKKSSQPILISKHSLHKETGTLPAQATHKVFGYIGYNFYDWDWCANPYLGVGGEVEFEARSLDEQSALNQWSAWIKMGFEF